MLKNVIGSEVGNRFKSRVVCKKASGKTLADDSYMMSYGWSSTGESRNSLAKVHVRIFGYQNIQFWFQYFYVGQPKIIAVHPGYHLGGPLGDLGFFVSCSTGACMMWCQRMTQICDCNSNVFPEPGDCWGTRLHQLTEVSLVQLLRRWV